MLIPLNEPSNFRYIYINPATNRVHLLIPFIAGLDVSTDNTCKSDLELNAFFEGGAVNELESYESTLKFHLSLLEEDAVSYHAKKERLEQIDIYLEAVISMENNYEDIVTNFLNKPSNLYSIQLRPRTQDPYSRVVNPVFTINRYNDSRGTPLSPLYNKMHEVFPELALGKLDPRTDLINNVLESIPPEFLQVGNVLKRKSSEYLDEKFHSIKQALKSQCAKQFKIDINVENWIRPDRSFDPLPSFNEETLPRVLTFYNHVIKMESLFPLTSSSSGLGFDFALWRAGRDWGVSGWAGTPEVSRGARLDLAAVRHLDEVRIADLSLSRENLSRPANHTRLIY